MKRDALADRCLNYADALVAYSLVNGLAFLVALGEPDMRCSIVRIAWGLVALNIALPLASTFILRWLAQVEQKLREGSEATDAEPDADDDDTAQHFLARLRTVRYTMVWLIGLMVIAGILAATQDARCLALPA